MSLHVHVLHLAIKCTLVRLLIVAMFELTVLALHEHAQFHFVGVCVCNLVFSQAQHELSDACHQLAMHGVAITTTTNLC